MGSEKGKQWRKMAKKHANILFVLKKGEHSFQLPACLCFSPLTHVSSVWWFLEDSVLPWLVLKRQQTRWHGFMRPKFVVTFLKNIRMQRYLNSLEISHVSFLNCRSFLTFRWGLRHIDTLKWPKPREARCDVCLSWESVCAVNHRVSRRRLARCRPLVAAARLQSLLHIIRATNTLLPEPPAFPLVKALGNKSFLSFKKSILPVCSYQTDGTLLIPRNTPAGAILWKPYIQTSRELQNCPI